VGDEQARALREALTRATPAPGAFAHTSSFEASLAESLATLGSCAALIKSATPLTRSVATDLVLAETRRAAYLLQASQAMRHDAVRSQTRISAADLLSRVIEGVEPERRLRRIALDSDVEAVRHVELRGDVPSLVASLALVMLAMMLLLDGEDGPCLVLSAVIADRTRLVVTIRQDHVAMGDNLDAYAEALAADAHPARGGVPMAALAIVALGRAAQQHDGRVRIARHGIGTQVTLELPVSRI
jgi:hypothetical protein